MVNKALRSILRVAPRDMKFTQNGVEKKPLAAMMLLYVKLHAF